MNHNQPLVSICCITYNHEKYIRNTLEGFLMQEVTFPIEIIIHDDASTDKTAEIVAEFADKYPDIIHPIFQTENQYKNRRGGMFHSFVFPHVQGKYIALCEGDDYWIDPLKLQQQIDFLEKNEDYGLVHTDLDQYDEVKNKWIRGLWKQSNRNKISGDIYDSLMSSKEFGIYLCTMCFRSKYVIQNKEFDDLMSQRFMYGDVPLYLHISMQSKIGYIPKSMAVRNVLSFSATQGQNYNYMIRFTRTALLIFEYFNNLRPVNTDIEKNKNYA